MKKNKGAVALLLCGMLLVGCGGKEKAKEPSEEPRIELTDVENADEKLVFAMGDAVTLSDMTLPDMTVELSGGADAALTFGAVCDADYDLIESFYHSYAKDGTAEEITIICVRERADVATVMESLQDHIKTRTGTMQEYDPAQVPLLENAILTYRDRYIGLFVSEKNGICKQTFDEVLDQYGI